jgi:hypothetical protein
MDWKRIAQIGLIPVAGVVLLWVAADINKSSNAEKVAEAKAQIAIDRKKETEQKKQVAELTPPKKYYAYDPPCAAGSTPHACGDRIWGKRLKDAKVWKVTWYGKSASSDKGHWVPDYTRVEFYNEGDEQVQPEDFCGNLLDRFAPGQRVRRIIKESDQSEYNGCYTIEVTQYTFGGKTYAPTGVEVKDGDQ